MLGLVVIMLRQSDIESPVPACPMDIDTPNGSILDADETQYPWGEKELQCIHAWRKYHDDMLLCLKDLENDGPVGIFFPKKPRKDIKTLTDDHKKKSKLLSGQDLHKYLINKLATEDSVNCPTVSEVGLFTSLESILNNLKSGYAMLKKHNSVSLSRSLDYGDWLNVAFELHRTEIWAGKISGTWKEWLDENVGIQDSYARKLREIAKLLGKCNRFRALGIPFLEVYQRRKQIQGMLITDSSVARYWRQ